MKFKVGDVVYDQAYEIIEVIETVTDFQINSTIIGKKWFGDYVSSPIIHADSHFTIIPDHLAKLWLAYD